MEISCMIHFYPLLGRRPEPPLRRRRLTASSSHLRHFYIERMRCLGLWAICSETFSACSHCNDNACMGALFELRNNPDVAPPTQPSSSHPRRPGNRLLFALPLPPRLALDLFQLPCTMTISREAGMRSNVLSSLKTTVARE
jgi:hypothetical protein